MTRKWFTFLVILCLFQTGVIAYYSVDNIAAQFSSNNKVAMQESYRDSVNVSMLAKTTFVGNIVTYGKVKSVNHAKIKAPTIPGHKVIVDEVLFQTGDHVNKNDILVKFKCEELKYKLQASLKEYEKHKSYFQRLERAKSNVSENDLIQARILHEKAEAEYNALRSSHESLTLKAPFSGLLGACEIVSGIEAPADKHVVHIVDQEMINVEFFVDAINIGNVQKNTHVLVETLDGEHFIEAVVSGVSPYIDENTSKVKVIAKINNSDQVFKHNLSVNVCIDKKPVKDIFVVPRNAVIESDDAYKVCKINRQGNETKLDVIRVHLVDTKGDHYAIICDGLFDGDYIVVEGGVDMHGLPVNIHKVLG